MRSYGASPGGRTSGEAGADGPDTEPSRVPEAGRGSREEGMWGCSPGERDLSRRQT